MLGGETGSVDKADITVEVVRCLVAEQFPAWADLAVTKVDLDGWDNATFRLGETMSVRLPSHEAYVPQIEKEHRWLPVLAPQLPLPIPQPLAKGAPSAVFPRPWSVYGWHPGSPANVSRIRDLETFAGELAGFLVALYAVDTAGGPAAGAHSFARGGPVSVSDDAVREAVEASAAVVDADAVTATWEAALDAETVPAPSVWVHGDVTGANLLVDDAGALHAVIDFGCSAVGDPACDLTIAWTMFSGASRELFRAAIEVDEATWARARGWALWKAILEIPRDLERPGRGDRAAARLGWRCHPREVVADLVAGS